MPPGAWRGDFCVTSLGLILGAGLYMEGPIFGILRYTVLERRSGKIEQNLNFVARGGGRGPRVENDGNAPLETKFFSCKASSYIVN